VVKFYQIRFNSFIFRAFYKSDPFIYKWHYDELDRKVLFLSFGKWQFQYDEELPKPIKLIDLQFIKSGVYHRIIRKSGILICIIKQ
jgi:hypothetical protein